MKTLCAGSSVESSRSSSPAGRVITALRSVRLRTSRAKLWGKRGAIWHRLWTAEEIAALKRQGERLYKLFGLVIIALLLAGCAPVRYHYFHAELGPDDGVLVTQGYFPARHLWIHADHRDNEQMAPDSTPMLDPSTFLTIWPFL